MRLAPGRCCSNFALSNTRGSASTNPEDMARTLREHWSQVFKKRDTDQQLRQQWINEEDEHIPVSELRHTPQQIVPLKVFKKAIRLTSNTSPGPDGIPFKAWRKLGHFAAEALHLAFVAITGDDGSKLLEEDWQTLNESSMVFLPKKPSGITPDNVDLYTANNMRPLSITNADNRIICSAVRLHIEPIIAPGVTAMQTGFIKHRSMLANVLDIEEAMLAASLSGDFPAAVFFDFEAAFPSVSQEFLLHVLSSRGWPSWCIRFVRAIYWNNRCRISVGGSTFDGFELTAGVRQGCPLSPLLFAVISDILLRRLQRLIPSSVPRAYADDLAVVLRNGFDSAPALEHLFEDYEKISGLRLIMVNRSGYRLPLRQSIKCAPACRGMPQHGATSPSSDAPPTSASQSAPNVASLPGQNRWTSSFPERKFGGRSEVDFSSQCWPTGSTSSPSSPSSYSSTVSRRTGASTSRRLAPSSFQDLEVG